MSKQPKLLLIENDQAVREALSEVLAAANYQVEGVSAVHEVSLALDDNPANVAVLDLDMSARVAREVFRTFRSSRPELPVVLTSARPEVLDSRSAFDGVPLLAKPFDPAELLQILQRMPGPKVSPESCTKRLARAAVTIVTAWFIFGTGVLEATTGFEITELKVQQDQVILRWSGGGTNNQVQRRNTMTGPWEDVDAPTSGSSLTNILYGTTAFYRVVSLAASSADKKEPSVPSALTATAAGCSQVNLSWTGSTDSGPNASGLQGYNVYRNGVFLKRVPAPATSASDSGLAPLTTYAYTVSAVDNARNTSAKSGPASVTTPACGCDYRITPTSAVSSAAGGTGSVAVTANNGCAWTASTSDVWITINSGASGSGSGNLAYSVSANSSSNPRTGSIVVAQQTVIVNQSANQPPTASAGPDVSSTSGSSVSFTAAGSSDPDGSVSSYVWSFGDGITASGVSVSHAYAAAGNYTVTLTVTDNLGATASDSALATVVAPADSTPPTVAMTSPASGSTVSGTIVLSASASDNAGGSGVARVEFYRDSAVLLGSAAAAPYNLAFDTSSEPNGSHSFYCVACDAAGNAKTSAANALTVNNAATLPGQLLWARDIGNKTNNTQRPNIHGVKTDHQGNVLVVGDFNGTMDFGGGPVSSYYQDLFVAKYAAGGQLIWFRHFGGVMYNVGNGIAVDSADNVIVTGYFSSTLDFGGGPLISAGNVDVFLTKFSATGAHVWSKRFGAANSDVGYEVVVDGNDNILVAGTFQYGVDFGGGVLTSTGSLDVFVAKFSPVGVHLWSKRLGGANAEAVEGLAVDGSGNAVLTGSFSGTADIGGSNLTSAGGNDIYVVKYAAANGAHLWSKRFGGVMSDIGLSVAVDRGGNVVSCGQFTGGVDFGGGLLTPTAPYSAIVLAKHGPNGEFLWASKYGGLSLTDCPTDVCVDGADNIVMTGYVQGMVDFGAGWLFSNGGKDTFIAKFSPGGSYQWANRLNGQADDQGATITTDSQQNIVAGGSFQHTIDFGSGPFTSVTSGTDAYLVRYGP